MAEKILKSLSLPGLPDTYVIPEGGIGDLPVINTIPTNWDDVSNGIYWYNGSQEDLGSVVVGKSFFPTTQGVYVHTFSSETHKGMQLFYYYDYDYDGNAVATPYANIDCYGWFRLEDPLNAYPVGSIYMSTSSKSPAELFGGDWEQIQNKFLLGAGSSYTAGSTGGAATVTLTTANLPSHSHNPMIGTNRLGANSGTTTGWRMVADSNWSQIGTAATTTSVGNGTAHNNMPPYLVVYMWQRVY